ncbi:hypothetical protein HYW74_04905 [Candidatus Pacearchaeota archaeon]|nr:hypothetical protein [Candidatus Pacearchaeota archaeon]
MKSKKGDLAMDKIISIILVIIVVILLISFLFFRQNFLDWIRLLPGYETPKEDTEIVIDTSEISGTSSCPIFIGKINVPEGYTLLNSLGTEQYIYINGKNTNLYWSADEDKGEIFLRKTGFDSKLGDINQGKVSILEQFLTLDSLAYQESRINELNGESKGVFNLELLNTLSSLNEGYYVKGNYLCRKGSYNVQEAWPGKNKITSINLGLNKEENKQGSWISRIFSNIFGGNEVKISTTLPYLKQGNTNMELFLYKTSRNFIIIMDKDNYPIGLIYPDGSVWFEEVFLFPQYFSKTYISPYQDYSSSILISSISNGNLVIKGDYGVEYTSMFETGYESSDFYTAAPDIISGDDSLCNLFLFKLTPERRNELYKGVRNKAFCESNIQIGNFNEIINEIPELK